MSGFKLLTQHASGKRSALEWGQLYEPRHNKMCLREFPTRPDTNRPVQPQKLASLEISAIESRDTIPSKQ